jgi:hypothetical protein
MKRFFTFFIVNTLVFGIVLSIFDYFSNDMIYWWKILVKAILFGAIMGVVFTFLNKPKKG